MRRIALILGICCLLSCFAVAQEDEPATREDIVNYMAVVHSPEMMKKIVAGMATPLRQFVHDTFEKDKDRLPPDFEARLNTALDDYLNTMPFDEMLQASIPIYQKHFTKSDINSLLAFYSSPTGQKLLNELPAITSEVMSAQIPIIRRQVEKIQKQMQEQIQAMLKNSPQPEKKSAVRN